MTTAKMYKLFKGFKLIGEFKTVLDAKSNAPKEDGVYNLTNGKDYRDSWQYLKGVYYGG